MPSNHTPNYQLSQWEADDRVLRTDFNADNAKIDGALGSLERTAAAHAALLPKLGNCQIYTAEYAGTGKSPVQHTFPHKPWFIIVNCLEGGSIMMWRNLPAYPENMYVKFTWEGNTVTWSGPLIEGMAHPDRHYQIIALLDMSD